MKKPVVSQAAPRRPSTSLLLAFFLLLAAPAVLPAQATPEPCTLAKHVYTCNKASFQSALSHATTIAIDMPAMERVAAKQLRDLVTALGKTPVTPGEAADLTVLVVPIDTAGVLVGPAGVELATLRIYAPSADGKRGPLLWAETFTGQPDMSWPATVHAVIEQFRTKFPHA